MTSEEILQLITYQHPESQNLEYKKTLYQFVSTMGANQSKKEKDKNELLKDVVAMANGGGGTIILGIQEDESGLPAIVQVGIQEQIPNKYIENIEQLVAAKVLPRLTIVAEKLDILLDTQPIAVVVINISASNYPLHCVQHDADTFMYYQRFGRNIKQMSPTDISLKLSQHSLTTRGVVSEKNEFLQQFRDQQSSTPTLAIITQLSIPINQDVLSDTILRDSYMRGGSIAQETSWPVVDSEINHFAHPTINGISTSLPNKTIEVRRSGTVAFHRYLRHGAGLAKVNISDGSQQISGDYWLISNSFLISTILNYFLFLQTVLTHWSIIGDLLITVALINTRQSFLQLENGQLFLHVEPNFDLDTSETNDYSPRKCQSNELTIDWQTGANSVTDLSQTELIDYLNSLVISRIANGFGLFNIQGDMQQISTIYS